MKCHIVLLLGYRKSRKCKLVEYVTLSVECRPASLSLNSMLEI